MHRYSRELLGYAVALFTCYGVFVSIGLGPAVASVMFLLLGITIALGVIVQESISVYGLPSLIGVVLFCTFGFATGWGGYQLALWAGLPTVLFGAGVR